MASLPTEMYSTPCMLNASPSVLFANQCFSRQYHTQKAALRPKLTTSGTVIARCIGSCESGPSYCRHQGFLAVNVSFKCQCEVENQGTVQGRLAMSVDSFEAATAELVSI